MEIAMEKPVVILADADYGYLENLEWKLAESYGNQIDLRVITDRDYFSHVFANAVEADIVLIGEQLFDRRLVRHSVKKYLVLTERTDLPSEEEGVCWVNRYANAKQIFSEVRFSLEQGGKLRYGEGKETEIIVVCSALGGSGKTTVALGLAACMSREHARVLYLSTETVQGFSYYLNSKEFLGADECMKFRFGPSSLYESLKAGIRREEFDYLPPLGISLESLQVSPEVYVPFVEEAGSSGDYDYIIVDTDTGCSSVNAQLMSLSDRVVLLVMQDAYSMAKTDYMIRDMDYGRGGKFYFVCSRFQEERRNVLLSAANRKFTVSEYVPELKDVSSLDAIASDTGIQDLAFLFL